MSYAESGGEKPIKALSQKKITNGEIPSLSPGCHHDPYVGKNHRVRGTGQRTPGETKTGEGRVLLVERKLFVSVCRNTSLILKRDATNPRRQRKAARSN